MNVNKKFDRFKQWAGERMGGDVRTNVSDDFKALELEMTLRHEGTITPYSRTSYYKRIESNELLGMERLQKSMTTYVKTLSKRKEGEDKETMLPVAYLGSTMVSHGEEFENDSEFGQCLISMFASVHTAMVLTRGSDGTDE
jgi:hypothetical protein